jgi:3-hydroxybutyryl-CoA dehydrogenase
VSGQQIGVVGAGTMGTGVAQCLAQAGYRVVVVDPDPAALADAPQRLRRGLRLDRLAGRRPATATGEPAEVVARVRWSENLPELADARFVIECVPERVPVKRQVLAALDALCRQESIFASCTSAIPIARLGSFTARPDRVIGTHFMNPAPATDTVEVIRAPATSQETLSRAVELLGSIGKKAIVVSDAPGFVTNRVLMLAVNEAARVVEEGTADAASVDRIFQDCFGHPMGPLRTADLIGLDTVLDSLLVLREHLGDPRFTPCRLLEELVDRGHLGRKAGRGFHRYLAAPAGAGRG